MPLPEQYHQKNIPPETLSPQDESRLKKLLKSPSGRWLLASGMFGALALTVGALLLKKRHDQHEAEQLKLIPASMLGSRDEVASGVIAAQDLAQLAGHESTSAAAATLAGLTAEENPAASDTFQAIAALAREHVSGSEKGGNGRTDKPKKGSKYHKPDKPN